MFAMFKESEGYTMSGYGSISETFRYVEYKDGNMVFKSLQTGKLHTATPSEFLYGLKSNYVNDWHRYILASNNEMAESAVVNYVKTLI